MVDPDGNVDEELDNGVVLRLVAVDLQYWSCGDGMLKETHWV